MYLHAKHINFDDFTIAQEAVGVHEINRVDKEVPSWECGSSHLWSLLDMLEIHAEQYIEIGRSLQSITGYTNAIIAPEDDLSDDHINLVQDSLRNLVELHLKPLQLNVSILLIIDVYEKYLNEPKPTWGQVSSEIDFISRAINAELQSRLFFYILPHRVSYFRGINLLSEETLDKFPNTKWEMEEAGKCFATERFTAAVHHLMRVAEYGLNSFAEFCKVEEKDRSNWNKALNVIEKVIRDKDHPNYIVNMTKEDEQYYTEAAAWLRNVKTAWRNPVSHIPTVYDEPKALELFGAVKSLMNHLSKRFREVPLVCSP